MRYCISDLHGKYELFQKLLNVIRFSEQDTMYICGDIIDKGESSIREGCNITQGIKLSEQYGELLSKTTQSYTCTRRR